MANDKFGCSSPGTSNTSEARLTALTFTGLALGVLIVGQVNPEPRVTLFDIPLNTALFVLAGVALASSSVGKSIRHVVFFAALPILLVVAATLWSPDIETGLAKSANLYLSATCAAGLLAAACVNVGVRRTLVVLLALLSLLLLFALLMKSRGGFFDRSVPYGLNGPIVFGRFMGVAAVIAALVLSGVFRAIVVMLFLLAVVWTQSKGPLLSTLIVLVAISLFEGRGYRRLVGLSVAVAFLAMLAAADAFLLDAPVLDRFVLAATFWDSDYTAANYTSIGARLENYTASVKVIADIPFGVGTGGWASATGLYVMEYPHNFVLEIASEMGLVLSPIVMLPFLAFLISPIREFRYIALLLALAQQTTGDLLDSRMWLAISLASIAVPPIHGFLPAVGRRESPSS